MPTGLSEFKTFRAFYDRCGGLRHFSARELVEDAYKQGNSFPPARLWPNVMLAAQVWDEIRRRLGKPCHLTSTYRDEDYNRKVGGVSRSQHLDFRALDGFCSEVSPSKIGEVARGLRGMPFVVPHEIDPVGERAPFDSEGLQLRHRHGVTIFTFAGGIGVYPRFVHIDSRGSNHTW